VNRDLVGFVQANNPEPVARLDMDLTMVETRKNEANFCYKGYNTYQPFNVWWAEHGVVGHTECGFGQNFMH
jgi:hypothetical protein